MVNITQTKIDLFDNDIYNISKYIIKNLYKNVMQTHKYKKYYFRYY